MAKPKVRTIGSSEGETINLIETDKFTFAYEKVPGFQSVSVGVWFPVGSRYEPEKIRGISHFIEHLIFKGTRKYNAQKISEIFDSLGAKVNAFTGKEMTCYYLHLLASNADKALSLLAEMLKEPAFRKKDVESERNVILQEIAMYEDSPDEQVHDYFSEVVFHGSSLGKPIIGSRETVSRISRDNIVDFYKKYYRDNRFYITAAGSVEADLILEKLSVLDGSRKEVTKIRKQIFKDEKNHYLVEKDTAQTHICIGFRIFGAKSEDRFTMSVLDSILGGMMSSRLFKEIREKRGLSYSTYSYATYYRDTGYICAYSGTSHKKVYDVAKITLEEFRKLVDEKVSEEELKKAKEHAKSSMVLASESMRARMTLLGKLLLSKEEVLTISEMIKRIDAVTADDLQRLASKYFTSTPKVAAIGKFDSEKLIKVIG
ncbi:MAG: insulinase family protein [Actinobacteria bacterium]|nr:insulinase family protein [Actinomycetota bacterium]